MGNLPRAFRADISHRTFDTLTNVIGTKRWGKRERERESYREKEYMCVSGEANEANDSAA